MTLGTAVLLLALAVAGIVLVYKFLRKKPKLRIACIVLLSLSLLGILLSRRCLRKPVQIVCIILCVLLALASAAYIGLTILFVDAVQNQPPVS